MTKPPPLLDLFAVHRSPDNRCWFAVARSAQGQTFERIRLPAADSAVLTVEADDAPTAPAHDRRHSRHQARGRAGLRIVRGSLCRRARVPILLLDDLPGRRLRLEILTREDGAFDLLLTDIKMPIMDGIALALAAARDFPRLTILLMTGFADQRERASGLNAIVHDVVTKPFSVADIRTAVADALAARKG